MNLKRIIREELIKESGVENYLQSIASITSGNQKKYYQWILDNLEQVPVVSYRSNEELEEKIDRFVKKMRRFGDFCQKKGCFDTAYNTAMYVPGVHYIEGYVQSMIPIVHAWNYLPEEGIYFDLINDIAWEEEDSHFNQYYKVIDLDKSGVLKWSSTTGYGGGFLESPQFINNIINKKNIKESIREEVMDYHNSLVDSIYEDDNFLIAAPKTHQSSCHYGSGTQWCTTTKDSRSFDEHNKRGLLFYIIDKNNKSKFAIYIPYVFRERFKWGELVDDGLDASFDSIEVYDSEDNDITGIWWSEDEPYYYKHIKDHFKYIYKKSFQ